MSKQVKPKKCKACKTEFRPFQTTQKACSPNCALELVKQDKLRASKRELAAGRKKLKTKSKWLDEAQIRFNRYIVKRDKGKPCISCGRNSGAKMNAGHYLSRGAYPELRFEEDNCHIQCEHCNSYLSGNIVRYRPNLIEKIGLGRVEWLEGPHEPKHYTIEQIQEIKKKYTKKAKEIENG